MVLKDFIKRIFYKIYILGKNEAEKKNAKNRTLYLARQATFEPTSVDIDLNANIFNNRGDASFVKIGKNSWLRGELLTFRHGGAIAIGENCFVGQGTKIWSSSSINIGDRVLISHNVNIHDNISHSLDAEERHIEFLFIKETRKLKEKSVIKEAPIVIEDDVWIGFNSTILKGVRIGKGSIVGANTVVTKDIPPFSVVVGNPAKIIKNVKTN